MSTEYLDVIAEALGTAYDTPAPADCVHPACSPARITLSRRKGWRMPPNTVKVCRPGKWGNPFHVADVLDHYDGDEDKAAADCVRSYRRWVEEGTNYCSDDAPPTIDEIQTELRGKNLACWCKAGTPCHADVLLEIANQNETPEPLPPIVKRWHCNACRWHTFAEGLTQEQANKAHATANTALRVRCPSVPVLRGYDLGALP